MGQQGAGSMQERQDVFLSEFAKTGLANAAILACRLPYTQHYRWLKEDPDYARRFAEVKAQTRSLAEANRKPHPSGPGVGRPPDLKKRRRQQEMVLAALPKTGVLMDAAREAGISPSQIYQWQKSDPEFRDRLDDIVRQAEATRREVVATRLSEASKARWGDPGRREAWSEFQRQTWTPEKRAEAGRRARERMEDPAYRAQWLQANRTGRDTPEARAANSARMDRLWADPEYRARHAATMADPATRQRISEAVKQQWAALTPDERKAKLKKLRRVFKGGYRLTEIESTVMLALNDREIPYLVHKQIDGYVADIFVPSMSLIIECDGAWHHSQRPDSDAERDELLRMLGYETLRLSEDEIKREDWSRLDQQLARLANQ